HLLLPSGEPAGQLIGALLETRQEAEDPIEVRGDPVRVPAQVDALEEVLLDGESGKEPPTLRDVKDAGGDNLFRLSVREIPFAKVDRAGLRPHQLRQSAEQRGLSGAVGAHERDDLSPAHLERDVPDNLHASVSRGKVFDFEKRLRGRRYFELS